MGDTKKRTIVTVPQRGRRITLSQYTKRTLGSGNLRDAVRLPKSEDENEWIAANTVDFFNEISLLYGMCHEDSLRFVNPGEGFPSGFEYRWADGVKIIKPVRCSSGQYVHFVLRWVEANLNGKVFLCVSSSLVALVLALPRSMSEKLVA
jgi:MOB kinase activator 1